jgi:hypothetical protein
LTTTATPTAGAFEPQKNRATQQFPVSESACQKHSGDALPQTGKALSDVEQDYQRDLDDAEGECAGGWFDVMGAAVRRRMGGR